MASFEEQAGFSTAAMEDAISTAIESFDGTLAD
jgi:hypothetical protein